jgi:hypothetical protein
LLIASWSKWETTVSPWRDRGCPPLPFGSSQTPQNGVCAGHVLSPDQRRSIGCDGMPLQARRSHPAGKTMGPGWRPPQAAWGGGQPGQRGRRGGAPNRTKYLFRPPAKTASVRGKRPKPGGENGVRYRLRNWKQDKGLGSHPQFGEWLCARNSIARYAPSAKPRLKREHTQRLANPEIS